MRPSKCILSLILVSMILLPLNVQAHSADTFTVVVKDTGLTPNSSQIMYNDSVIWHNVDSSENITHRIVFDGDGDGCTIVQTIGILVNYIPNVARTIRRIQVNRMIAT